MQTIIGVLGHFGEDEILLNGQTVKTKIITDELQRQLGREQVRRYDTHGGLKVLLKAPLQTFSALKNSRNVLILPAQNGLRVYAPLLALQRRFLKGRKLHYAVIGGWLPDFLQNRRFLEKQLRSFDGIYVETRNMKMRLEERGFNNVVVMPNCKELDVLSPEELVAEHQEPYKLCTFSRVMREKGIEDAVDAVKSINEKMGRTVYTLDIYGPVDPGQTEWFGDLQKQFPSVVRYCGAVPFDRSVAVLKEYFALLFPTRFYTEGVPGTVIDGYAAGLPVIAAKWESFADVIDDQTGFGFDFGSRESLYRMLEEIAAKSEMVMALKMNCLDRARAYMPQKAIGVLMERIEGK